MPMFNYRCTDCFHKQEHFTQAGTSSDKACPKCGSTKYAKLFSKFKANIEYANHHEHNERVIDPGVAEIYNQIGKEALDEDANTLENVFGTEKVKHTLAETDD